ncbi:MAG: PqqD family protein [Hyphomicrobiales bacterium]|nr:PqqD family protein [Hyphomicrobiales bacterium]
MLDESAVLSLTPNALFQALGEGAVVLLTDSGQIYTCNETTEALLKLIDGQRNYASILDAIAAEFDVDRATLTRDFAPIVAELRSEGIVAISTGT